MKRGPFAGSLPWWRSVLLAVLAASVGITAALVRPAPRCAPSAAAAHDVTDSTPGIAGASPAWPAPQLPADEAPEPLPATF